MQCRGTRLGSSRERAPRTLHLGAEKLRLAGFTVLPETLGYTTVERQPVTIVIEVVVARSSFSQSAQAATSTRYLGGFGSSISPAPGRRQ